MEEVTAVAFKKSSLMQTVAVGHRHGACSRGHGCGGRWGHMTALKHIRSSDSPFSAISPARDMCHFIITRHAATAIIEALGAAGAFSDRCHGQLHLRQTVKAFTYMEG